jgi:hypothetical protein
MSIVGSIHKQPMDGVLLCLPVSCVNMGHL